MSERENLVDAIEELDAQITRLKGSMRREGNGVKLHRLRVITWLRDRCLASLQKLAEKERTA